MKIKLVGLFALLVLYGCEQIIPVPEFTIDTPIDTSNITFCFQPYSRLVGWWRGDGNAVDAAGASSDNGLEVNGATYATGKVDQAFSFDGLDDYVTIQDAAELNPTNAITVSAWIKLNSSPDYQSIVSKFYDNFINGPNDDSYSLMVSSSGELYWQLQTLSGSTVVDNVLITNPVNVLDNQYHLFSATYDGSTMKVYLDGQEIVDFNLDPGSVSGNIVNSVGTPIYIGSGSSGNTNSWFANGLVDEVTIYNIALSDAQIINIYYIGICTQ